METRKLIIAFDGVCNLCNGFVDWLVRRDDGQFLYTSLQGEWAKSHLPASVVSTLGAVIVVDGDQTLSGPRAVIAIGNKLRSPWNYLSLLLGVLPNWALNAGYHFVAINRYQWFGERQACRVPTNVERAKFLD